jgi:DNA-binding NtrC family response regulator
MTLENTVPELVLLVDDEPHILLSFSVMLKSSGISNVRTIQDSREVMPFLRENPVAVVVLDLAMPYVPGEDLLIEITQDFPQVPVIVMTATNEIDTAVQCMQDGAVDYLAKPVEKSRFVSSVKRALENRRLRKEVSDLKRHMLSDKLEQPDAFSHIVTHNKKMFAVFKYIEAICHSSQPVVVTGETGVGKELIARAIHLCARTGGEFVAVNAAGLDDTMFSDTLFGHKKGAFTDAHSSREGLIARAADGTLFLDEIGDLNAQSQVKLLRLIQESEYYQLGSDMPQKTNARLIVATNRNLEELMEGNIFRRDLYYRLCAHLIRVPPLRERQEDIPLLLGHFLQKAAEAMEKNVPEAPPRLADLLAGYEFPGNIRELEALVYDAVSRHRSGVLSMEGFKQVINDTSFRETDAGEIRPLPLNNAPSLEQLFGRFPTLKQVETALTEEAMKRAGGNQGTAASMLGLTRQALNKRLKRRK